MGPDARCCIPLAERECNLAVSHLSTSRSVGGRESETPPFAAER